MADQDRSGEELGKYRLVCKLGEGGFAEVYLAEHSKLKTQAAVKVLRGRLAPADLAGFLAEAQTVARLVHPHILRVLDYDDEGGVPYLVLEYAPGGSLRARHPPGSRVPLETVISNVQQVAEACNTPMTSRRRWCIETSSRRICCWTARGRWCSSTLALPSP